jgi:hypothetical protein
MNQRWGELMPNGKKKGISFILAFFPVVASSTNLSTSIQPQSYEK